MTWERERFQAYLAEQPRGAIMRPNQEPDPDTSGFTIYTSTMVETLARFAPSELAQLRIPRKQLIKLRDNLTIALGDSYPPLGEQHAVQLAEHSEGIVRLEHNFTEMDARIARLEAWRIGLANFPERMNAAEERMLLLERGQEWHMREGHGP